MAMGEMKTTPVMEDYLQTIYSLQAEGKTVIGARLAKFLGVSAPTVTTALQRLAKEGYITFTSKKEVMLTPSGYEIAEVMVRRHRLAERLLRDVLGLDWVDVHEEAHRFEHVISPRIEQRLMHLLKEPATCPHGSPIPGLATAPAEGLVPLDQVPPETVVVVERITEEAEIDHQLLSFLGRHHIMPGARLTVVETMPWAETMTVLCDGETVPLVAQAGGKILVRLVER
jgi:DtxR family Mn-dependent transcriptional regulator